ncbi:hypothetical protein BH11PLA2_BH11PLA2_39420 [soil metagenome]
MSWLQDALYALAWAVAAATMGVAVALSGFFGGLVPIVLPLVAAPLLAYRRHDSTRVAWLVALWEVVFVASAVVLLLWAFRDFRFRAMQG